MLMPTHYAISEILIVFAASVSGWQLYARGERLAAAAIGLFAIAALIGAIRYGVGLHEILADSHRLTSAIGGLVGILLLLLDLIPRTGKAVPTWAGALFVIGVVGLAALIPIIGVLVTFAAFVIGVAILIVPESTLMRRMTTVLAFGAVLVVGTPLLAATGLNEATRWHIYHVVAALWIALLPFCLWQPQRPA
jgi:hypothetical protein